MEEEKPGTMVSEDIAMSTLEGSTAISEQPRPFDVVVAHKIETNEDTDDEEFFDASDQLFERNHGMGPFDRWVPFEDEASPLDIALGNGSLRDSGTNYRYRRRIREHHDSNKLQETTQNADDDDDFELDIDEDMSTFCLPGFDSAKEHAGTIVKKFWAASAKVTHFYSLPEWLQDNDFLHTGHRPPMPHFGDCLKSVFALHTETGNIWTHVLGCVAFIGVAAWFLTRPYTEVQYQEKIVFGIFFLCAIACLGMSSAFHTVSCHSIRVGKLFSKLDYVGISLLSVGSFIPWLFYGFYCRDNPKIVYIALITMMGCATIIVSLWDKFATPRFRPVRAGMFVAMGLSGVVPAFHKLITDGLGKMIEVSAFHWLLLMAILYIGGAGLYAARIPERFFPGKCDIWFQSHQIFHLMVIAAAFVHYHGISEMAVNRLSAGSCDEQLEYLLT